MLIYNVAAPLLLSGDRAVLLLDEQEGRFTVQSFSGLYKLSTTKSKPFREIGSPLE